MHCPPWTPAPAWDFLPKCLFNCPIGDDEGVICWKTAVVFPFWFNSGFGPQYLLLTSPSAPNLLWDMMKMPNEWVSCWRCVWLVVVSRPATCNFFWASVSVRSHLVKLQENSLHWVSILAKYLEAYGNLCPFDSHVPTNGEGSDFSSWHCQTPHTVPLLRCAIPLHFVDLLHLGGSNMTTDRMTMKIGPMKSLWRNMLEQVRHQIHCLQVHALLPWKGCVADHHPCHCLDKLCLPLKQERKVPPSWPRHIQGNRKISTTVLLPSPGEL